MMKDVEFSCVQKVMISTERFIYISAEDIFCGQYFLAAKFQVAQRNITHSF